MVVTDALAGEFQIAHIDGLFWQDIRRPPEKQEVASDARLVDRAWLRLYHPVVD